MLPNDCYLTEDQKDILRALAPDLRDRTIETQWIVSRSTEGVRIIGLDYEISRKIALADLIDFENCGFLKKVSDDNYDVNRGRILKAVETNFGENQTIITASSIFGEPLTTPQFQTDIFMVMPFKEELKPVYEQHIKPIAESLGFTIKRGDEVFGGHFILREIFSLTHNCKIVIADCTGQNANVYYELGLAHMLDKKAILIAQSDEDIRFDVEQMRYIVYKYPHGMKEFEAKLKSAIESILE